MKRLATVLAVAVSAIGLGACGGTSTPTQATPAPPPATQPCPGAANNGGHPGVCAPKNVGLFPTHSRKALNGIQYQDRSNNNPCSDCGNLLKQGGYSGLIAKANQGTGFIDSTAVSMIQQARASGLTVGLYDFDQDYSVAEAQVFISRLHAAGIFPNSPNTFPAYLDVESGNFSYSGLLAQIGALKAAGYRVGIYTGTWYWTPHAGCQWPAGITAWLSGYPTASVPCGLPGVLFQSHQYTDSPVDISVFLGKSYAQFVNAGPVKPVINHHYGRYDNKVRHFHHHRIIERSVARRYDKLRAEQTAKHHPHRAQLKRLRKDSLWLAQRIHNVATRHSVGVWGPSPQWDVFHRRYRHRQLLVRAHGGVADHHKKH